MNTRDHLLTPRTLKRETVDIEGETITVQEFDGFAWGEFQTRLASRTQNGGPPSLDDMSPFFVVLTVVEPETGNRVFTMEDIPALQAQPARLLLPIVRIAQELSGIQDADMVETAKND